MIPAGRHVVLIGTLVAAVGLSGCVYSPFAWKHPTASASQREDDWRACDRQSTTEAYDAARQANVEAKRVTAQWDGHAAMAMQVTDIESVRPKLFARCMEAKGYLRK